MSTNLQCAMVRCCWALLLAMPAAVSWGDEAAVDYLRDIKPVLKARCFACHGALKQEAGLRLDTVSAMLAGGENGPAIVAKEPGRSAMVTRITSQDEAARMPPEGMPLTAEQQNKIQRWIAAGAPSVSNESPEADPREHWAFQEPVRTSLPRREDGRPFENPIDAFITARLNAESLSPRPLADKATLLRRVYLDLIGLPPSRDELLAFLADDSPLAYEAVVDRLLNSPRHGERWGRHWMDVWRYSDWYGRRNEKDVRNSASQIWRWRDWIVRSLNNDRGYDQMLGDMLAADELRPEDPDSVVATGYLIRNYFSLNPNDWMRNIVEHSGKAFLGLTFNCAHCHDHKYDPISQADYFRLRAFFEPIYVRQDRLAGEADPGPFQDYNYASSRKVQRLGLVRIFDKDANAPTWFYSGGDERNRMKERGSIAPGLPPFLVNQSPLKIESVSLPQQVWYPGLNAALRDSALADARAAIAAAEKELHAAASQTASETGASTEASVENAAPASNAAELARCQTLLAAGKAALASVEARIAADRAKFGEAPGESFSALAQNASRLEHEAKLLQLEAALLNHQKAIATAETKPESDTKRAKEIAAARKLADSTKADLEKAKAKTIDPKAEAYSPLTPIYPQTSTGRRTALARWLVDRRNPLTARVAVNHIWLRHFHAPLVSSVFDFGRNGARPTHPELLDWLAVELMETGWSMKHLHRLIVTSETYRRVSSASDSAAQQRDPENKLLWRMNAGRMESEVVRDSLLHVGRRLDLRMGGQELENNEAMTTFRRSLYYSCHPEGDGKSALGALFDSPDPLDCYQRPQTIIPQQSLALTNSDLIHDLSASIANELLGASTTQSPHASLVTIAFQQILARSPQSAEAAACAEFLQASERDAKSQDASSQDSAVARRRACEGLVRVLLNHNDFVSIR